MGVEGRGGGGHGGGGGGRLINSHGSRVGEGEQSTASAFTGCGGGDGLGPTCSGTARTAFYYTHSGGAPILLVMGDYFRIEDLLF